MRAVCFQGIEQVATLEVDDPRIEMPTDTIVEIVREDSLELKIFVRQSQTAGFVLGEWMDVTVDPYDRNLRCQIVRLGGEYQQVPTNLEKFFKHGERVLPVYLRPAQEQINDMELRLGSVARIPFSWSTDKDQHD